MEQQQWGVLHPLDSPSQAINLYFLLKLIDVWNKRSSTEIIILFIAFVRILQYYFLILIILNILVAIQVDIAWF